jgi:DNA mismatch repair protein MutS
VERKVVRVVTPGTLTETELLSDKTESMLLAVHQAPRNRCGLAWLSVTQGELHLAECAPDELDDWLARIAPSELLYSADVTPAFEKRICDLKAMAARSLTLCQRPEWQFDGALGQRKLLEQLHAASLSAWSAEDLAHAHAAAAALLAYAEHTQGRALSHVQQLRVQHGDALIDLPVTTRRNLELVQTLRGEDAPTLFSLLDTCMTGMGSRTLKRWLLEPPARPHGGQRPARRPGRAARRPRRRPLERAARPAQGQQRRGAHHGAHRAASGAPARTGGAAVDTAKSRATMTIPRWDGALLTTISRNLTPPDGCAALLAQALLEEPAALVRDGGVIAGGLDAELDELRAIQTNCDAFLLDLETREKARTGIANLRVQFNRVHGFYIEVTQGQLDKVPDDYRRRQTLKNAERFITPELKTFEDKALSAQERALAREKWLYEQLLDRLQDYVPALTQLARAVAALDALCALAERSLTLNWCAPQFAKEPCVEIRQGRHPVVEARLAELSGGSFIANDTALGPRQRMQIITGPNMGGKSTYMRQVALIVLMASMGSYVPASFCRLGPIDAIHTRIGAADDLANAQSTFMLEMTEAAQILHSATPQSLVLMDEIGRGTSTFDGLALASGIAAHLHDKTQAFTLFATHYFELTEFPASHHAAVNVHVSAAESGGDIVFLHEIQSGPGQPQLRHPGGPAGGHAGGRAERTRATRWLAGGWRQREPCPGRSVRRAARDSTTLPGAPWKRGSTFSKSTPTS